jgi:NhaP-type Na+/H+ or K+/H+ antiporter
MHSEPLIGLASIVVLGVAAQWIAWRLRLPAILLLLALGLLAGPGFGWLDPDKLFGHLLFPWVSLSVAVILLEGGLSLRLNVLREVGSVVFRLTTIGMLISWAVSTLAAHFLLGFEWRLASMLGAILVVTGPTVIAPLLRHLRLGGQVGSILKWEGIVIDPVGVVLAVIVFAAVRAGSVDDLAGHTMRTLVLTTVVGVGLGLLGALILYIPLRRYWIPDSLQAVALLAIGLGVFTAANQMQEEAGLIAVTVTGIALSNQRRVAVRHLIEFKEHLTILLVSCLFIVLAARLKREQLAELDWRALTFVLVLIIVARPLAVLVSTWGSSLNRRERLFLASMAPRGIVAAAVSSVFALYLSQSGVANAGQIVPLTFAVIIGTVTFYGLLAAPLAQRLGLARPDPNGVLFVGTNTWSRALAELLQSEGVPVLLVDSAWETVSAARQSGLPTFFGSILAERTREEVDVSQLGQLVAMTSNDEVNSLACLRFIEDFGRGGVYQLSFDQGRSARRESVSLEQRGRLLFGPDMTYDRLIQSYGETPSLHATRLTAEFDYESFRKMHVDSALPLVVVSEKGRPEFATANTPIRPVPGQTIISALRVAAPDDHNTPDRARDGTT